MDKRVVLNIKELLKEVRMLTQDASDTLNQLSGEDEIEDADFAASALDDIKLAADNLTCCIELLEQ